MEWVRYRALLLGGEQTKHHGLCPLMQILICGNLHDFEASTARVGLWSDRTFGPNIIARPSEVSQEIYEMTTDQVKRKIYKISIEATAV